MAVSEPKIVIVGCGISGIAAARKLVKAGFNNVRILEATARSGGRIKTDKLGNYITEIGATYIHGPSEENPVFCLARDYGLLDPEALKPENQAMDIGESLPAVSNWFSSSGQKLKAKQMESALEMFENIVDDTEQFENRREAPWASVGHFIRETAKQRAAKRWKGKDETTRKLLLCAISTMLKVECCSSATHSMDELDLVGFSMYEDLKGLDCTFPDGYEGLIRNLMSELPSDIVSYSRPVRCVHWNNSESEENTVTVECHDGERIAANHVIVTVPLGYLKKHHSTLFSPPLPAHKLRSIQKLGFGTCNKIYVEFETPWWDADCDVIYLVWEDEEDFSDQVSDISKSWIKKMVTFTVLKSSERCSHVLCGWIAGHESEYMETLPEHEVRQAITELLRTFTGNPTITPKRILRSEWFHDPWTCGSYSHPAIGCSAQDLKNMMGPLPTKSSQSQLLQVLFAGEATHPCYYSSVHGALLTGWREADRLISHYSSIMTMLERNAKSGPVLQMSLTNLRNHPLSTSDVKFMSKTIPSLYHSLSTGSKEIPLIECNGVFLPSREATPFPTSEQSQWENTRPYAPADIMVPPAGSRSSRPNILMSAHPEKTELGALKAEQRNCVRDMEFGGSSDTRVISTVYRTH